MCNFSFWGLTVPCVEVVLMLWHILWSPSSWTQLIYKLQNKMTTHLRWSKTNNPLHKSSAFVRSPATVPKWRSVKLATISALGYQKYIRHQTSKPTIHSSQRLYKDQTWKYVLHDGSLSKHPNFLHPFLLKSYLTLQLCSPFNSYSLLGAEDI
jgi:hypothetical protein